ncbi:MAG: hydrogenase nickel incorporation protein HypB [bacterium]
MEIRVVKKILAANEGVADENREMFARAGVYVINLMSSPGSGKTTLLERTLERLSGEMGIAVIEGDIRTTLDAERLNRFGAPIVQINTEPFGGDCHLEAAAIKTAVMELDLGKIDLLVIENVGNLVCPAEFVVGEDRKMVVISVAEGEDKPLKYPLMFRECGTAVINKTDLVEVLEFPIDRLRKNILQIRPDMKIIETSARTGAGIDEWCAHIKALVEGKKKN